jgi:hypothetical protein
VGDAGCRAGRLRRPSPASLAAIELLHPAVQVRMFAPVEDFCGVLRLLEIHGRNVFFGFGLWAPA